MAKRKASMSAPTQDTTATATASPIPSGTDKAAMEATMREDREYLLASVGATPDNAMAPPAKKRKTAKKTATKKEVDVEVDEDATTAKTAESQPETPRNAAVNPNKPKAATKKRKASVTLPTPSDSPESRKSDDSKHDSGVSEATPPKAKKAKSPPKKRNAEDAPPKDEDAVKDASPTKKRKSTTKRASPKTNKPTAPEDSPPQPPPPKPLNPLLAAKVSRVRTFIATRTENSSLLSRDPNNPSLITLPEQSLIGALMRLRADYEIGDRYEAQMADIEPRLIARTKAPVLQNPPDQWWLSVDLGGEESELLREVRGKVEGRGLEGYDLLEMEMEMQDRQARESVGVCELGAVVSGPEEMRGFWKRTFGGGVERERAEQAREAEAKAAAAAAAVSRVGEGVRKRMGVCPAPPVLVV